MAQPKPEFTFLFNFFLKRRLSSRESTSASDIAYANFAEVNMNGGVTDRDRGQEKKLKPCCACPETKKLRDEW